MKIIICNEKDCLGKGYYESRYCSDYHKREWETVRHTCKKCNGSGRLIEKIVTTFEPYVPEKLE